jgi:hypothetical protein
LALIAALQLAQVFAADLPDDVFGNAQVIVNNLRWNSTEVDQRLNGTWKIVHSHWSYVKPVLKEGAAD